MSETDQRAWYQNGVIVFWLALITFVLMAKIFVWYQDQRFPAIALCSGQLEQPVLGSPSLKLMVWH